ncbi:MAG: hypothetical protein ACRCTZ_00670 [Sarcina sp.]
MSQNIALIIAFLIVCALFVLTSKLKVRNKLSKVFYNWFHNVSAPILHTIAFIINFGIIVAVGIGNSMLQQLWFTLTVLPIGIVIALNITTSLIAVAKTVKYESMHGKIKAKYQGKPRPKVKNKK